MESIPFSDTSRHVPIEGDESWQESFFIGWTDVRNKIAGHHHISLCPHLGLAHLWSWVMVDGKEVSRIQEHRLPLPSDDLRDFRIGPLHFTAGETIRDLRLQGELEFEGLGAASIDITYKAWYDPFHISFNAGKLKLGSAHYESMGSARGTVSIGERVITVNGAAWQDHSWGPRRLSSNPAGRWIFAAFGDDLAISLFSLAAGEQTIIFGYVHDNGLIDRIEHAQCGVVVGDDGISPESCDTSFWTASGRGYRVTGKVVGTALVGGPGWTGDGNHFWMDGLARFELGGRIGSGIIEVSSLKSPTEAHRAILRLD